MTKKDNRTSARSDTKQPTKHKQKSEEYLKYKAYIRSNEWKSIRDRVLERDGYRCVCCGRNWEDDGKQINLSVHHSTYDILYEESENMDKLVTLCRYCHSGIHKVRSNFQRFNMK